MQKREKNEARSTRDMSIEERVQLFFDMQQALADGLGIAFAVDHGAPFPLYDIWGEALVYADPNEITRVSKKDGKLSIEREERRPKDGC